MFTEPAAGAVIVVVSPAKLPEIDPQFATRLAALTEPRPVAKSYPAVAVHAGVVAVKGAGEDGSTRTPIAFNACVLQSGVFVKVSTLCVAKEPTHATELLPFVMSLNVHAALMTPGPSDELQALAPGAASWATASL